MSSKTVRRARPSDCAALAELRWQFKVNEGADPGNIASVEAQRSFSDRLEPWLKQRLATESWLVWVAEVDGRIVGNLYLCRVEKVPNPRPGSAELGYVTNFYVAPAHRNQGLGGALLTEMRQYAEREGMDTLIVWPSERSVPLYQRVGFGTPHELFELPIDPS